MESFEEQYCALCHSALSHGNFNKIQNDIFEILLLKLDFPDGSNHVMCNICSVKVMEAFKFKSMCICTDNTIIPFVDDETECLVDLRQIYAVEKGIDPLDNHKVCRLCMQLIKGEFVSMQEVNVDVFEKYIPEINLSVVREPILCIRCFNSICTHGNFIKTCVKVEKVNNICGTSSSTGHCELSVVPNIKTETQIKAEPSAQEDDLSETGSIVVKSEYEDMLIKNESIDIKPESDITDCKLECEGEPEVEGTKRKSKNNTLRHNALPVMENPFKDHQIVYEDSSKLKMYQCEICAYETKNEGYFSNHQLKHKSCSEGNMFNCMYCEYKTKFKKAMQKHFLVSHGTKLLDLNKSPKISEMLNLNDILPAKIYKWDSCTFKTKEPNFLSHQTHKKRPFKCDKCNYTTRLKFPFMRHQLVHKNSSEVEMYKCHNCSFETKYKNNIAQHQLTHKNPHQLQKSSLQIHQLVHKEISEVPMYKCNNCDYAAKQKGNLKSHQLVHRDASEVTMYKCNVCEYATKHKYDLKCHQLVHRDASEVTVYKCNVCEYAAKRKLSLKRHLLVHKDPSDVTMYKCNICEYAAKRKLSLKRHLLVHKDASEVAMYKCDVCKYTTNQKVYLKRHLLVHKAASEVTMYKCDGCDYAAKRKDYLKSHLLVHKAASEVTMYKCDICDYATKRKFYLKKHLLVHKGASEVTIFKCNKGKHDGI